MVSTPSSINARINASDPETISFINNTLINHSDTSFVSTRYTLSVGSECFGNSALSLQWQGRSGCQFFVCQLNTNGAAGYVDDDDVAILDLPDISTAGSLWRDVADAEAASATRETTVGNQGSLLAQVHTLYIRGGIEHLLHARTALWPLVGDDHAVATLHLAAKNTLAGIFL